MSDGYTQYWPIMIAVLFGFRCFSRLGRVSAATVSNTSDTPKIFHEP